MVGKSETGVRLSDVIGAQIKNGVDENVTGHCVDFLIDIRHHTITYCLAKIMRDGQEHAALLRLRDFKWTGAGIVFSDLAAVHSDVPVDMQAGPLDLTDLPPIVVGPFGFTYAPAMVGALINDAFSPQSRPPRPDIAEDETSLCWYSHLLGLPVFQVTTDLGRCTDVSVTPDNFNCKYLIIAAQGIDTPYPFSVVRQVAKDGSNIILDQPAP